MHKDEIYDLAHWAESSVLGGSDSITEICKDKVQSLCNLCPDMKLDCKVSTGEDGLRVTLGVRRGTDAYHSIGLNPARALSNLVNGLLVEDCRHDSASQLNFSDSRLKFTG